jgi:Protein phosphatase 2C
VDSSNRSSDDDNGLVHLLRSPSKSPRTDCGYSTSDEESGCVWRDSKVCKVAEDVSSSTTLIDSCLRDAIICESIRRSHETLDKAVTETTNSGSTISSLYLDWEDDTSSGVVAGKQSKPVNVYCANVGDSRCVMLRSYNTASALMLPTSYKCQSKLSQQNTDAQPVKLQPFPDANHHLPRSEIKKSLSAGSDLKLGVPIQCIPLSPLLESQRKQPTQILKNFTAVHLMSEDHTLALRRERERIENRAKARWHALPADASAIYLPAFVRTRPPLPTSTQSLIVGNQTNATGVVSADPAHVNSNTLVKKAPTSLAAIASIPSLSSLKVGASPKLRAKEFLRARISHPEQRLTTHGGPVGVDLNAWNGKKASLLEVIIINKSTPSKSRACIPELTRFTLKLFLDIVGERPRPGSL